MKNILKVSELNKSVKERTYQENLHGKYEVSRGEEYRAKSWRSWKSSEI